MTALTLDAIEHAYLGRIVLSDCTLKIDRGEIVALVVPSGCGKSTLAHIAAGFIAPKSGRVIKAYTRHAMIFQDPRLLPWATAAQNIAYPLRIAGISRAERRARVAHHADQASLNSDDLLKYPSELSGGMRQRVAIARALAFDPDFIFFDEPFTALDVALKRRMQDLVMQLCTRTQMSGLFITHDLLEAARLADRIVVMESRGQGIVGMRPVPGTRGQRTDAEIFEWVQTVLATDPMFRGIHDVDERRMA